MRKAHDIYRYYMNVEPYSWRKDHVYYNRLMDFDKDTMYYSQRRYAIYASIYHTPVSEIIEGLDNDAYLREYSKRAKAMSKDADSNYKRYQEMKKSYKRIFKELGLIYEK